MADQIGVELTLGGESALVIVTMETHGGTNKHIGGHLHTSTQPYQKIS